MRTIYLIRHGRPDIPSDEPYCLGQTCPGLGPVGRMQGVLLKEILSDVPSLKVYTSPLPRAVQTAAFLSSEAIPVPELQEINMGLWDGLPFSEIRQRFPDLYRERGENPDLNIPEGESRKSAASRFQTAFHTILAETEGNLAIVSHASVILSFITALFPDYTKDPWFHQPYGSCFVLSCTDDLIISVKQVPSLLCPHPVLTNQLCLELLKAAGTPDHVRQHCIAVSRMALHLADQLVTADSAYQYLNMNLICQGSLLHDIARTHTQHSRTGSLWLCQLGYPEIAEMIRLHNDPEGDSLNEAAILFLADKYTMGSSYTDLKKRFQKSKMKCNTMEARAAFDHRYRMALHYEEMIDHITKNSG